MYTLDSRPEDQFRPGSSPGAAGLAKREEEVAASQPPRMSVVGSRCRPRFGSHLQCDSVLRGLADHVGVAASCNVRRLAAASAS